MKLVTGLHHITALTTDPQKNVNFYAGILGLRLVKKTINFDAPEIYHLYYGNEKGEPGTLLTFFPYEGLPHGRKGNGQLTVISFSISENALGYWMQRLHRFHIKHKEPERRFDETVLYFEDHDGLGLELVANGTDKRSGFTYGNIPAEYAIKGFYGITVSEECFERTGHLLTDQMDFTLTTENTNRYRYAAEGMGYVDILCNPDALRGMLGAGTVHHVAFATATDQTQLQAREKLLKAGLDVTPVLDREYFHSIYYREPGGVLFEIATVPPGFMIDEPLAHLGESLKLPPWEEPNRALLESVLPPIFLETSNYAN